MRVHTPSIQPGDVLRTDVCIIGAGPAGITVAMELDAAGVDVLLVDSGGETVTKPTQGLAAGEVADNRYYRLDRTRLRAFGGTSNHWIDTSGMRARPLDGLDFESRPEIDRPGWPLSADDMQSWYRRAHEIAYLGPLDYRVQTWAGDEAPPLPVDERTVSTAMFQIGPLDAFTRRLPDVSARSHLRLLLGATGQELVAEHGDAVDYVRATTSAGAGFAVQARRYVLAAGGIDNPRLLLLSHRRHASGLGNAHDQVGRHFMEHPHLRTGFVTLTPASRRRLDLYGRRVVDGVDVMGMLVLPDDVLRRERILATAWALHPSSVELLTPAARAMVDLRDLATFRTITPYTAQRVTSILRAPGPTAKALRAAMMKRRPSAAPESGNVLQLAVMSEQEPNPDSRVLLGSRRDRYGQRVARVQWRLTDLDRRSIRRAQELIAEELARAGVGVVADLLGDEDPPASTGGGFHHMGTTRMAASPRHGVVDADCMVYGVPNLSVVGTSVFSTGGYANPTLTVIALAARLAHHLRNELAPTSVRGGPAA